MLWLFSPALASNRRKMRRYSGFCKATERPNVWSRDRRGSIFCQCKGLIRRSPGAARILPLPKTGDSASVRPTPDRTLTRSTTLQQPGAAPPRQRIVLMASTRPLARALGAFALAAFLVAPAVVKAQDTDPVVARVNGVEIHQSDLALAEDEVGASMPQMAPEQKREYLITYFSDVVILAQAAEKQNIGDRDDVKHRLTFERNKVLMETLLQDIGKAALTDDAMHKVYDEAVKQLPPEEEVHARHILVPTEAEAKDIEAELKKGADFASLAKEKSKDPGAADGGDLGYFTKDQMVPEFSEAAFKLDKGQISDPVHTQFGWHIIKVEDKRTKPTPTFDQVRGQIENYIARRAQSQLVDGLRKTATIERLDKPEAPSPMLNPGSPVKK